MIRRLAIALLALAFVGGASAQNYTPGRPFGFKTGFQFLGGAGGFPTPGAVADFDFKNNRYTGPAISVGNSSGGYVDDSQGNWALVPPNTARRSDKGLLVEGAQTNSIRNNSMQGAVAGAPGTVPTNWSASVGNGLSRQVISVGTESGIDYVDIRLFGTATGGGQLSIIPEGINQTAGSSGQLWTGSFFLKAVGGVQTGITLTLQISGWNGGSSTEFGQGSSIVPTNVSLGTQRYMFSRTLSSASTTSVSTQLALVYASGAVLDYTLRIGWPQLEQWSTGVAPVGGASSPIRTTGAAATRAADSVSAPIAGLSAATLALVGLTPAIPLSGRNYAALSDGSYSNRIILTRDFGNTNSLYSNPPGSFVGGVSVPASTRFAIAGAVAVNDRASSVNGSTVTSSTTATAFPTLNQIQIGADGTLGDQPFGYIERLAVLPYRASNDNLQRLSTLANYGG